MTMIRYYDVLPVDIVLKIDRRWYWYDMIWYRRWEKVIFCWQLVF